MTTTDPRRPYPGMQERLSRLPVRPDEHRPNKVPARSRSIVPWVITFFLLLALVGSGAYFVISNHWVNLSGKPDSKAGNASPDKTATKIFSGRADEFSVAPGNTVQADISNPGVVWIRSSVKEARSDGATGGVALRVPSTLAKELEGKRIRITVSAKTTTDGVQAPFGLAYSMESAGNSGWLVFQPTNEFKDFSFRFAVPRGATALNQYVGIWSDISGSGAPLAIRRITISRR